MSTKENMIFDNMTQIITDSSYTYRFRLQGALNSPNLDWSGDLTIIPQETGEILLVSLFVDQAALHGFLDQFRSLDITILPDDHVESENLQVILLDELAQGAM